MENGLVALSQEIAGVVERAKGLVVAVHGRPRMPASGLLWKNDVIITADHTVRRDEEIKITLPDGSSGVAEVAGRDPGTDLAALRLKTGVSDWAAPATAGALKPGYFVLALGRSPDSGVNATLGVLSAVSGEWRTWRGGRMEQYLRLDVNLYPTSAGGPVVDASGNLVGISTHSLSRLAPVAIPAATVERVSRELLEKGHVGRGYLGVGLQPVRLPEHLNSKLGIGQSGGLMVMSVEPDSPAGRAGLEIGDVLLGFAGKPVVGMEDLEALLGGESVGKEVKLSTLRGGEAGERRLTVGERPRGRK